MTVTLKPSTEALLLEKARLEGQKREAEEIAAAVRSAMAAAEAGREKPLDQYLTEQRAKRGLPDTWPSAKLIESETGVVVAGGL